MTDQSEYYFSEEALALMERPDDVMAGFERGQTLQAQMGFSPDAMCDFYEEAQNLIREELYQDGADAFIFLTTLNPMVSEFWIGLGWCEYSQGHLQEALIAFKWACAADACKIEPYLFAVDCCLRMGDKQQAEAIAAHAMEVGRTEEKYRDLYEKAKILKESIRNG